MSLRSLEYSLESDAFEAEVIIDGKSHNMTILDFSRDQEDEVRQMCDAIVDWLKGNLNHCKWFAASQLLTLKNDSWLQEDEMPLTEEQFAQKIIFDGIYAFSDGSFEVFFLDNDIFWGHHISVDLLPGFIFERAGIAG